jgi:hypothetical protein
MKSLRELKISQKKQPSSQEDGCFNFQYIQGISMD